MPKDQDLRAKRNSTRKLYKESISKIRSTNKATASSPGIRRRMEETFYTQLSRLQRTQKKSQTAQSVIAWKRLPTVEPWNNPSDYECEIQNDTVDKVSKKQGWLPASSLIQGRKQGCYGPITWSPNRWEHHKNGSNVQVEIVLGGWPVGILKETKEGF